MPRVGPDISHHQDRVDLESAKGHVHFVFLKATQSTGFVDDTFDKRWRQLANLGIPRGAYHFAIPSRSAAAQATHFVSVVQRNGFRAGDAAILDMEQLHANGVSAQDAKASNSMSAKELNAWVKTYVKDVRDALPVENVVFYTGIPFWNERMGHPAKLPAGCIGWLSRYNANGPYVKPLGRPAAWPPGRPDIWQFTDGTLGRVQTIPGIGKCDCNEMTEACFQRLFKASGLAPGMAPQDDITEDELLGALASDQGQKVLQDAVRPVVREEVLDLLRRDFGGLQPGATTDTVRGAQKFLFETVEEISSKLPKS